MNRTEITETYRDVTRALCGEHGAPLSMYADTASTLVCPKGCEITDTDLNIDPDCLLQADDDGRVWVVG